MANVSTNEVRIRRVGGHDAVDSGGVDTSNVILPDESTELRVVPDSLDSRDGEYSERKENTISRPPGSSVNVQIFTFPHHQCYPT